MKSINKYIIIAALATPLALTSCSDSFLDVTPPDKATVDEYFSTYDHIIEAMAATYNPMREYDMNNIQYTPLTLCSDVMGDDVWPGGASISDNQHLHKMFNFESSQNSSDALSGIWDQSYKGVRNANDVLHYIENSKPNLTDTQYNTLSAEARTLRAFYYMQLWKFYGNIPFYMENLKAPYIAEQKSANEVYETVISDLESAISLNALPMKWDDNNIGRMSQAAAYMIYAEMVMYQNDESRYQKALSYMQQIISDTNDYDLNPDYANIFLESGEWSKESIFEICYKDDNALRAWGGINNAGGTIYPRLIGPSGGVPEDGVDNGWGFEPVREETYNMFAEGDIRRDATVYDARKASYTKRYQDTGLWLRSICLILRTIKTKMPTVTSTSTTTCVSIVLPRLCSMLPNCRFAPMATCQRRSSILTLCIIVQDLPTTVPLLSTISSMSVILSLLAKASVIGILYAPARQPLHLLLTLTATAQTHGARARSICLYH